MWNNSGVGVGHKQGLRRRELSGVLKFRALAQGGMSQNAQVAQFGDALLKASVKRYIEIDQCSGASRVTTKQSKKHSGRAHHLV